MSETGRYAELAAAVAAYGRAAMENLVRCRALGYAIADALPAYLSAPQGRVALVPHEGPFDPGKAYGDQAFSFAGAAVVRLAPISVGVCVIVPHAEDSGAVWVRVALRLEISGDDFDVYIGSQPVVRVPLDFFAALEPALAAIHAELLAVFARDLAAFEDAMTDQFGFTLRRTLSGRDQRA